MFGALLTPSSIAIDASSIYVTELDSGSIRRIAKDASTEDAGASTANDGMLGRAGNKPHDIVADSGDGDYGLSVSPTYIQELQLAAAAAIVSRAGVVTITRLHMILCGLAVLTASGMWTMLINWLSGR